MKFNQTGPTGGDCTAPYSVTDIKAKTVGDFILEVLKENPGEWGYISIKGDKSVFRNPRCEYRYGKLVSSMPNEILSKEIESVSAHGGWSRMDYLITLKRNERT